jgi:transposase-like protein
MPMNRVQFQPGLSMREFLCQYGTEERCEAALIASRWSRGFECPRCGVCEARTSFQRQGRCYWQCAGCQYQCSVLSGTIFEASKLPLTIWFLAMQLLTLVSDGLNCFKVAASAGAVHDRQVNGGGKASVLNEKFRAVNTLISKVKTALTGTYHAIKFAKYAYRYLADVQFRFNRRYDLRAILRGLLTALVRAPRRPECGIRVAELHR